MNTRILIAVGLLVVLAAGAARADAPEPVEYMPHPDGRPGMWLEMDFARFVLGEVRRAESLAEQLRIAEARLELRGAENEALRASLAEVVGVRDALRLRLDKAEAWYRSPPLWFAAGGLVSVGLLVLLGSLL